MSRSVLKPWYVRTGMVTVMGAVVALAGCESKSVSKPQAETPESGKKAPAAKPEPAPKQTEAAAKPKPNFAKPPKDAVVLFDGKSTAAWVRHGGGDCPWKVDSGAMVCVPRKGSIHTKETFGDCKLHIEFRPPLEANAKKGSQGRGNSGVYLQGRYEVQVLDSYDIGRPIQNNDCGALYSLLTPSTNACLPPNEWQSYDITFRAPKFDANKKMTKKGRLTVVQNGITIIDDKEIPATTPGGIDQDPTKPGALMLQDHGNTVAYRNIWLVPLK